MSLRHHKTQVARLEKEPEVLVEYASIIEDELEAGIMEKVVELEKALEVHYLQHQAVIRKQSTTMKVQVVYDASSRESKTGMTLNDCRVGFARGSLRAVKSRSADIYFDGVRTVA